MTNTKIRKAENNSKEAIHLNRSDLSSAENGRATSGIDSRQWLDSTDDEYSAENLNESKYIHFITEDADEVNNDSNTSTSFSLQECMNEFRARRIRRTSLSQHRKELDTNGVSSRNGQGTAELDLIKQNLCNKEQERKCKPCQNGFCYCFTSDSGDGGGNLVGLHSSGGIPPRNSRQSNRSECIQLSNSGIMKSPLSKKKSKKVGKTTCLKSASKSTKRLKAISSLETSTRDAPLIHIIQELHDNCVISKVNVNQHKMQSFVNNASANKITAYKTHKKAAYREQIKVGNSSCFQRKSSDTRAPGKYAPTAPILQHFLDLESTNTMSPLEKNKKCSDFFKQRGNAGGQLLQKRLSISKFNYKPKDTNQAPRKPPRTSHTYNDNNCGSSTSTSPSVREAEKVIDNFLSKNGVKESFLESANKLKKNGEHQDNIKKIESVNRKSYPLTLQESKRKTEKYIFTYSSLSDLERVKESKWFPLHDKNITSAKESVAKVINIGWNEAKIKDMLNYEANTQHREFHSTSVQAQPQQNPITDLVDKNNPFGWKIPPKTNLDTVDGIVHRNLASNLGDKNTPVKAKVISPPKNTRDGSRKQKFIWFEQLKHLSPWSNKYNINDTDDSKQNLRCSPKAFIVSSKKKLIRLVSPKKENGNQNSKQTRKSPSRNVGVQTSYNNVSLDNIHNQYFRRSSPQSPPGSYHSPMQSSNIKYPSSTQSQNSTSNEPALTQFDFSRTVRSPPKKASCSSQRKLNFPLNCSFLFKDDDPQNTKTYTSPLDLNPKKTYRSFNSELEQDVSLSKISYILSNIRAKLEASDQQAMRIFLEAHSNVDHNSLDFDFPESHYTKQTEKRIELHKYLQPSGTREDNLNDPIYSEIEDDSVYISESPDFDNHTGIQHFVTADNPDIMYAKVNKRNKRILDTNNSKFKELTPHLPLAKIMYDSFKSKKITTNFVPLPTLNEPSGSEGTSYSLPLSSTLPFSHCQSLNNVRVMEQNSSPKKQKTFSKSDLSLNRSEIFLENLCKSELVVEKNDNKNVPYRSYISIIQPCPTIVSHMSPKSDQDFTYDDTVSYEMPNEEEVNEFDDLVDDYNSTTAGSNLGLNYIVPPSNNNQSTPKKQSFVTKDKTITCYLGVDGEEKDISDHIYNSCQTALCKQTDICIIEQQNLSHSPIMNTEYKYEAKEKSILKNVNALKRYNSLKNVLHKSFRRSKNFIRNERKRLSTSLNCSINNVIASPNLALGKQSCIDSNLDLNLEALFSLNETSTVNEQIAQTVSICRKLPDLEISMEMVEAERLLLFSALRQKNLLTLSSATRNCTIPPMSRTCFFIDDMFLPVLSNVNQDIIFNYFYIITFECGGVIKSTQSAECVNGTAIFRDSGIEFIHCSELKMDTLDENSQNAVKCNIFMLRLRKLSTVSNQLKNSTITKHLTETPSSTLKSTSSSTSSSSINEVVSRFRLHAKFTLNAKNFVPYEYVHQESNNSDRMCIRSSCFCTLPLTNQIKSTNLAGQLRLKGRAEVRVPKHVFNGFLNVQDSQKQHSWNRRWCTLDGIFLYVWQDKNSLNTSPLIAINLIYSKHNMNYPVTCSPRELCARPRSFCLECKINKACEDFLTGTLFFAADTQEDLHDWLKNLNIALDFIATWLK